MPFSESDSELLVSCLFCCISPLTCDKWIYFNERISYITLFTLKFLIIIFCNYFCVLIQCLNSVLIKRSTTSHLLSTLFPSHFSPFLHHYHPTSIQFPLCAHHSLLSVFFSLCFFPLITCSSFYSPLLNKQFAYLSIFLSFQF